MMMGPWDGERRINTDLQRLRRDVIAEQLTARGWSPNSHKFETVVSTKLRKVRHLSHCRYDNAIDPIKLKKAHDDFRTAMERRRKIAMRNQARNSRHG